MDHFELDTTAPRVVGVVRPRGASGVSRGINLKATFSEPVYDVKKNFKLYPKGSTRPVAAVITPVGGTTNTKWVLNPERRLRAGTLYVARVRTGVVDKVGRALDQDRTKSRNQPMSWSFKTRRQGREEGVVLARSQEEGQRASSTLALKTIRP